MVLYQPSYSFIHKLMVLELEIVICNVIWLSTAGTATVTLTSTLDGRQTTCLGEVVTYTCTALSTSAITWFDLPGIDDVGYFANGRSFGSEVTGDFQLALTNRVPDPINPTTIANLTTTLTFTATLARNGTVVQCGGDDPSERMSLVLNIASERSVPFIIYESCML